MFTNRLIPFIAIFFAFTAVAIAQKTIELQYPDYSVTAFSQSRSEGEMKPAPFLTLLPGTEKGKAQRAFGIFAGEAGGSAGSQTVLEIIDAAKNMIIKKVTRDEYFGKETAGWQKIDAESMSSPEKLISAFRVQSGAYTFKFIREIGIIGERNLPLGKELKMTFAVVANDHLKIRIRFIGVAAGSWKSSGSSFAISDPDTLAPIQPALVFHPLAGSTIEAGRPSKKNDPVRFIVTGKDVSLSGSTPTIIFALEAAGTTISFKEHIGQQVKNLQSYFDTHIGKPEVVAVSQASKMSTRPGDTLMFLLYSHNIGTAAATANALNNIIPAGTSYLEGSAEGKGSTIIYTRKESKLPQIGQVTNITWKFQDPMYPGEQRTASFRVEIQ
jgi:uncharacterized repeat protein (TIGR01451 family)